MMNYKGNIEPQQTYFSKALSRREKHCFSMVDHLPVVFHSPVQQKMSPKSQTQFQLFENGSNKITGKRFSCR